MSSPTFRPIPAGSGTGDMTKAVYDTNNDGTVDAADSWGGQSLPSIDDATGEQVLRLKSDKSALEFATVSGGTSAYGDLTDIPAAIAAIDGLTPAADKIPYYTAADAGALADLPSGYNYIINPCFEVNQRGVASVTANGAIPVDQWRSSIAGSSDTVSQQAFTLGQTDVPGEPKHYLRCVVTSLAGAGNLSVIVNKIESVRTLAGRTATLSFYAKADAAKPISIEFNQAFGSGGSPSTIITGIGVIKLSLSTTWTKYIVPVTFPSISGKTIGTDNNDYVHLVI